MVQPFCTFFVVVVLFELYYLNFFCLCVFKLISQESAWRSNWRFLWDPGLNCVIQSNFDIYDGEMNSCSLCGCRWATECYMQKVEINNMLFFARKFFMNRKYLKTFSIFSLTGEQIDQLSQDYWQYSAQQQTGSFLAFPGSLTYFKLEGRGLNWMKGLCESI